jgi:hypothetical protein
MNDQMKVTVEQEKPDYPCLKKSETGLIVFFSGKNTGVCVSSDGYTRLGQYNSGYNGWNEEVFTSFVGKVTLEN